MLENKNNRTELRDLGEFGLIEQIKSRTELKNAGSVKGIGDDAAVIDCGGKLCVVSTDMLVEGVHFDLAYCPLRHLGYKAVVVNLSDIFAMNAVPQQITVSIGVSNRFSLEAIEAFYEGVYLACEHYEVDLVGGDTSSSAGGFIISVTAIGYAEKDQLVYRDTAAEHDLICVTGDLGAAYLGLQVLEREKSVYKDNPRIQPDLSGYDYIIERQLKPEARWDIIERLKENGIKPTSMIDISDGLASELIHICRASGTGCAIYEDKIPVDPATHSAAADFNLNATVCALSGGEDYELLFTVKLADLEKIKKIKDISLIGHITEKAQGMFMVTDAGASVQLTAQGWDAFLNKGDPRE